MLPVSATVRSVLPQSVRRGSAILEMELEMVAPQLVELESVGLELELVIPQLVELESVRFEFELVTP